ncbi:MAG TPA: histidine--tRNA ligase [Burkholderiales bacterium]|nr:histidine--tRNA ligase [Burkholderiales bacterium]
MSDAIQAVRGMNDVLPDEAELRLWLEGVVAAWFARYGYRPIRTPLLEQTGLFRRAIGEATDIVEKEMYTFTDALNNESLTLRPEATASTVRAAIEHSLVYDGPKRLWYEGPMYRHERPQKGRYREFYQFGAEALGYPGPDVDAELIVMCAALWKELGLEGIRLELNTIGSPQERARYRADLVQHLQAHEARLDGDARRRLLTNPLRVLDSKNPLVQEVVATAPSLHSYLGEESRAHFEGLQQLLAAAGVTFQVNPRLVRGLDYYNLTVFEWISERLGAQGTVCGGGRYDGLFAQLGGKPTAGVGFAAGVERLVALLREAGRGAGPRRPDAYLVFQGEGTLAYAFALGEELRAAGHAVVLHAGGGSFKSQMRKADASGAQVALIIGEDELKAAAVTVKPLRDAREQQHVPRAGLAGRLADILKGT